MIGDYQRPVIHPALEGNRSSRSKKRERVNDNDDTCRYICSPRSSSEWNANTFDQGEQPVLFADTNQSS